MKSFCLSILIYLSGVNHGSEHSAKRRYVMISTHAHTYTHSYSVHIAQGRFVWKTFATKKRDLSSDKTNRGEIPIL
jgi:hypothetical protein